MIETKTQAEKSAFYGTNYKKVIFWILIGPDDIIKVNILRLLHVKDIQIMVMLCNGL